MNEGSGRRGRALAAGIAEQRRRNSDLLPRLDESAVRSIGSGFNRARAAGVAGVGGADFAFGGGESRRCLGQSREISGKLAGAQRPMGWALVWKSGDAG